jgi:hypothetical protein
METRLPVQGHPAIVWRDVPVHLARPKKHRGKQAVFVVHSIVISDLLVGKKTFCHLLGDYHGAF